MTDAPPFSRIVDPGNLPSGGAELAVVATAEERAAIAAWLGLLDLAVLEAKVTLERRAGGRLTLAGRLHAELVQSCVVSLEPVPQIADEAFERRFVPAKAARTGAVAGEVEIAVDEAEPPETYGPAGIDVGAVVLEHLILGLDPYPRAPGASLPEDADSEEERAPSPFAILKTFGHSDRA